MTFGEKLICAVITPVGPGHDTIFDECSASVTAARENNSGAFNEILHLRIDDPLGKFGAGKARDVGTREAITRGSDWIFFLDADDVMTPNAFELISPYLNSYDAVWGAVCRLAVDGGNAQIDHTAVPVCQNLLRIFNEGLDACLTESHFMRASKATCVPYDNKAEGTDFLHHAFAAWRNHRCVKISRPLAVRREGKASENTRRLPADSRAEAARHMVTEWADKTRPTVSFSHQCEEFRFRFNGANKYQERAWLDGKFWESEELDYLTAILPPHPSVMDIGANVGNHAVYFDRFSSAIPLEVIRTASRCGQNLEGQFGTQWRKQCKHRGSRCLQDFGEGKLEHTEKQGAWRGILVRKRVWKHYCNHSRSMVGLCRRFG